ncbi:tumor necrosis factor ligand superfamily member 9 [Dermochelys coriacea]|uniref:tumor necrosis factor ligand superfamily member 9 n=1 Tax=Dermochelys coriacea TaxID=27794 RepID=UPI0018E72A66|nr:tumor necrosis factor ligand superfamily member 9 [Dermochelys coriacea]
MTALESSPDPESLLPAGSRRACPCRSLDWCLLLALGALGAALLTLALFSVWRVLPPPLETQERPLHSLSIGKGAAAQVLPKSDVIKDRIVEFSHAPGIDGVVFSSNFNDHDISDKLEVKVKGLYFIYAQLAVKCIAKCSEKQTVELIINKVSGGAHSRVLTISLHLSSKSEETMSKFSAVLQPLKKGDSLYMKIDTNKTDLENWQLDQTNKKDNFFGLFRLLSSDDQ